MKKTLLILSLFLSGILYTNVTIACSCAEFPAFCEEAIHHPKVLVKILHHDLGYIDDLPVIFFTDVVILDNLSDEMIPDTISILNQNGFNCNGSIFDMNLGDSVIISLPVEGYTVEDPEGEIDLLPSYTAFDLFGCGTFHLRVKNDSLGGGAYLEQVALSAFLNNPSNNCPQVINTTYSEDFPTIEIGPNPIHHSLLVSNKSGEKLKLQILNLNGQLMRRIELGANQQMEIPVSDWPTGPYILRQQALNAERSLLLIKQ